MQIIKRQAEHLTRLVVDLLDVERFASGELELRPGHAELSNVIASAVEGVRPLIESRGHHLDLQIPESGLPMFGDAARLRQVFANLQVPCGEVKLLPLPLDGAVKSEGMKHVSYK